jgi:NAD kinase
MNRKIVIFGGSFNPPAVHHRKVAETLSRSFDEVVVVPCGPRPDKPTVTHIDPIHRAVMADLAFRGLPRVRVELFDLELGEFTRTHRLDEMFRHRGEVWHAVGADLIEGGGRGESFIHRIWEKGPEIWGRLNFAVLARDGYRLDESDLPPHHIMLESGGSGSSTDIRERIFRDTGVSGLVSPDVERHIGRYNLYRGFPPRRTELDFDEPRCLLVFDEKNPAAAAAAEPFLGVVDFDRPNCIVVVGGDGAMMRAIGKYWRLRLPFYGFNAGHRGHLMNDIESSGGPELLRRRASARLLPLIYAETVDAQGRRTGLHAVNDAWVERASGQAAWIEIRVDGKPKIKRLVADGALVATPVGSTAYAKSLGGSPLPIDSQSVLLVGSNVSEPFGWKQAPLPLDSAVEFVPLDPRKRPIRAFVDGRERGVISEMKVRVSRVAAVELAFAPEQEIAAKMTAGLFPHQA